MAELPWRKVVASPGAAWLSLPLAARGLAGELLRYVDRRGSIEAGDEDPAKLIARLLGAHPYERRWIRPAYEQLERAGFVVRNGSRLELRTPDTLETFGEQPADVEPKLGSSGAAVEPIPSWSGADVEPKSDSSEDDVAGKPAEPLKVDPGEKRREEKRRINTQRAREALVSDLEELTPDGAIKRLFLGLRERTTGQAWTCPISQYQALQDAVEWATAAASTEGLTVPEVVQQSLDGYERDPWARSATWPFGGWASDPGKYRARRQNPQGEDAELVELRRQLAEHA